MTSSASNIACLFCSDAAAAISACLIARVSDMCVDLGLRFEMVALIEAVLAMITDTAVKRVSANVDNTTIVDDTVVNNVSRYRCVSVVCGTKTVKTIMTVEAVAAVKSDKKKAATRRSRACQLQSN